jgi:outer membrane protein/protease secretion system outer membrane protein
MKVHASLVTAALLGCAATSLPARADDLLSLYREAVRADAAYLIAQSDAQAKREAKPQALARMMPNLSFSGSAYRNTSKYGGDTAARGYEDRDYNSHSYVLGVVQPVFRAGLFAAYKQSQALVEQADASLQWAEQETGTRLGLAYFNVLLAEAELEVTKVQRDAYLAQLDYAQKAFQTGSGTRTDVDEARSRLDLAAAQTIELQYQLDYARDTLSTIVDRPLTPLARLNPERMQIVPPDPARAEDWIRAAEEVNPQLIALRAAVAAADQQVNHALTDHLPTVDLIAQRSKSKSESANTYDLKTDSTLYGLRFDMPIFEGGGTMSKVRQARAELDKARRQLEATRREVDLQVKREFDGMAQGVNWIHAYEQAVKSAEQSIVSTRKGFSAGTRTTLDILLAEQNLANARRDLSRGRHQYALSRLRLLSLVGRLNEESIRTFNDWLIARGE